MNPPRSLAGHLRASLRPVAPWGGRFAGLRRLLPVLAAILLATPGTLRAAETHLLLVSGIGGEPHYDELFLRWAASMRDTAIEHAGLASDQVITLSDRTVAGSTRSTKENILGAIAELSRDSAPEDLIVLVLIGHGSGSERAAFYNVPGPDLSATELADALRGLPDRRLVVVNTTPSSAPFLQALSAPGRVVITATATAAEQHHTRFGGQFVAAFTQQGADTDKDRSVSILEAFNYASREVQRSYELDGQLLTEHAQLDDDGDGVGARTPGADTPDGAVAAAVFLGGGATGLGNIGSGDARRVALQVEARELIDRIEVLKRRKDVLDPARYEADLEALLIPLALNRRAYRGGGSR